MRTEVNKKRFNILVALRKLGSTFGSESDNGNQPKTMNCERQISRASSLENYRLGVLTLMSLKSGDIITNSEPAHAAILFEVFFKSATDKVRIFCKNLSQEVFGNPSLLAAARSAVERGVSLNVLLQDDAPNKTEFSEWISTIKSAKVCLRIAPEHIRNASVNFAVMDTTAYRYEPDRSKCVASASMYNPDTSSFLAGKFDEFAAKVS
jgi:hypothetical protein